MSDRYLHLTVALNEPHDGEMLERLVSAIEMLSGVADVVPGLRDFPNDVIAKAQVRRELGERMWKLFQEITSNERSA